MTLSMCAGLKVDDPDPAAIERALRTLSKDNWFAILDRGDTFVQVSPCATWYDLEHRGSSDQWPLCAMVADLDEVVAAFIDFARGDTTWPQRFTWQKIEMEL